MIKTLTKHGNSHALVIDRSIMEQLGITPDSALQVTVTAEGIIITPAEVGIGEKRVREIMKQVRARYGSTLKKLAE